MKTSKEIVYEIKVSGKLKYPGISEILHLMLHNVGVKEEDITEYSDDRIFELTCYYKSETKFKKALRKIRTIKFKKAELKHTKLTKKDWTDKWKEDFKPFALTRHLTVIPAWNRKSYDPKRKIPVYIDSSVAFGTGLHETTRFMVRFIEEKRGKLGSVLDVGTGTGILSIVASKYGAKEVTAVDISPDCVKTARQNMKENGCSAWAIIKSDVGKLKLKQKYDYVAANLITHVLSKNKRKIVSLVRTGGYLAISGVGNKNLDFIKAEYKKFPLHCLKITKGKKWSAILYKKVK